MAKTRKILLLPGDGIGPEVVSEVRKILEWMNKTKSLDFVLSQELIGGASIDANKVPITDEVFYGKKSKVWQQALNRVHVQKSILLYCLNKLR